jgi:hypothetical protein
MKVKSKIISGVVIICVMIVVNYFLPSPNEINKSAYEALKFERFTGIVQTKYLDKKNHNHPTVVLKNKFGTQEILLIRDRSGLFEYIENGDSIVKEYGSYEVELFSGNQLRDTIFVMDYWGEWR